MLISPRARRQDVRLDWGWRRTTRAAYGSRMARSRGRTDNLRRSTGRNGKILGWFSEMWGETRGLSLGGCVVERAWNRVVPQRSAV